MVKLLSQLQPGEKGTVAKIRGNGPIQRRVVDMGLVIGSKIEVQKFAPLGIQWKSRLRVLTFLCAKTKPRKLKLT